MVKVGIIGIGNMGGSHAESVGRVQGVELTAVCDIDPRKFDRLPERIRSQVKFFDNSEAFFADADVDLVMIAVPHYAHPDLAIAAMKAGRHFILEKPICVHKAEAERLLAECARHPELVKSAMFNQRTRTPHLAIKELLDAGELGAIRRVNWIITDWFRTQAYYDSGDWRASWRGEGGGVLLNQCPHQLDLMQWFFGMPSLVSARVHFGKYHDIEVEDEVNAYLEYPNGATGNFITTTGEFPGTNRLEVTGDRGKLVFEGGKLLFTRTTEDVSRYRATAKNAFGGPKVWHCEIPYAPEEAGLPQHMRIVDNVVSVIRDRSKKLLAPVEEGIRGLELGNAMLLSGLTGKPVQLPMDSAVYAAELAKLVANSRYQKKAVVADDTGFGNSFGG